MRLPVLVCFLACVGLSHPAHAQAIDRVRVSPAQHRVLLDNNEVRVFIPPTGGGDCIARMADTPGRGTSTIESAKLLPGNPMPGFLPSTPRRIVISVDVDTAGRADPTTLQVPPELDSAGVNGLRTVLPQWRFVPARVSGCPVKQVVRLTFTR